MFYSDSILAKKGSLARVWLAAHWEKKLSKSQFLQTNIQTSVGAIVGDGHEPMALRLSGQLLLGVVRIYSRKARYLLEDCNDALVKIKMAFRPGAVDLPDEQAMANFNAITLADAITEFDILLPEPAFDLNALLNGRQEDTHFPPSQNVSKAADITIRESQVSLKDIRDDLNLDLGGLGDASNDLNFNFDYEEPLNANGEPSRVSEIPSEIELGRDAAAALPFVPDSLELGDITNNKSFSADRSMLDEPAPLDEPMVDAFGLDAPLDFTTGDISMADGPSMSAELPNDLGDFNDPNAENNDLSLIVEEKGKKGKNAPVEEVAIVAKVTKKKGAVKKRKVIVDDFIELPSSQMKQQLTDASDIMIPLAFVPLSSRIVKFKDSISQIASAGPIAVNRSLCVPEFAVLFDISNVPLFIPKLKPGKLTVGADAGEDVEKGRLGTEPILDEIDAVSSSKKKRKASDVGILEDDAASVRRKTLDGVIDDGPLVFDDPVFDNQNPLSPIPMADFDGGNTTLDSRPADDYLDVRRKSMEPEPVDEVRIHIEPVEFLKERRVQELTSQQASAVKSTKGGRKIFDSLDDATTEEDGKVESGFSKTTLGVIQMLQEKFSDTPNKGARGVSFKEDLAKDVRRSDSARLFFEILVLKTKNLIDVTQPQPYNDITIKPKKSFAQL